MAQNKQKRKKSKATREALKKAPPPLRIAPLDPDELPPEALKAILACDVNTIGNLLNLRYNHVFVMASNRRPDGIIGPPVAFAEGDMATISGLFDFIRPGLQNLWQSRIQQAVPPQPPQAATETPPGIARPDGDNAGTAPTTSEPPDMPEPRKEPPTGLPACPTSYAPASPTTDTVAPAGEPA